MYTLQFLLKYYVKISTSGLWPPPDGEQQGWAKVSCLSDRGGPGKEAEVGRQESVRQGPSGWKPSEVSASWLLGWGPSFQDISVQPSCSTPSIPSPPWPSMRTLPSLPLPLHWWASGQEKFAGPVLTQGTQGSGMLYFVSIFNGKVSEVTTWAQLQTIVRAWQLLEAACCRSNELFCVKVVPRPSWGHLLAWTHSQPGRGNVIKNIVPKCVLFSLLRGDNFRAAQVALFSFSF